MRTREERQKRKTLKQHKKFEKKQYLKSLPLKKKIIRNMMLTLICFGVIFIALTMLGTVVRANGLVDETINTANEYSKYSLNHYQLDFYADNSWGWLPWNWGDGIGKSVMYGLYAITNFIWTISLYLSNATGFLVQEAYSLDFISQTANSIGTNIQTIAGVSKAGFSTSGFYVGFLLILIFIVGIYVAYTGLLKRETTKAIRAVLNFVVVFLLSASFIAFAPDYITKINDFSKDISNASLDVGTKLVLPNSSTEGKDSVDMIRDSLFAIQVKQPWLLLQYGTTDLSVIGDRAEELLATSPDTNKGEDRESLVKTEINDHDNTNLTLPKTVSRLGTVFFLFIFNIGISIFVFLLTGIMIFSQVLFIIFAMFLPISFLLSMIPSFDGMGRRAIMKLFNVIMTRAGITLIISVAFSLSAMFYSLAENSPFFMIMFLQIVTFAGIYFKLGDLMSLFSLQSNDSQGMGRQLMRRPRMFMHRQTRKLQRSMARAASGNKPKKGSTPTTKATTQANHERPNDSASPTGKKPSLGKRLGETTGKVMDTKNRMMDKAGEVKDQIQATPTNMKYAVHQGKRQLVESGKDFGQAVTDTRQKQQQERTAKQQQRQQSLAQKRQEMDKERQQKQTASTEKSVPPRQSTPPKERPVTTTTTETRKKAPQGQSKKSVPNFQRPAVTRSSLPVSKQSKTAKKKPQGKSKGKKL